MINNTINKDKATAQDIYNILATGTEIKIAFEDKIDADRLRGNLQGVKRRADNYLLSVGALNIITTALNMTWKYDTRTVFSGIATFKIQPKRDSLLTYIILEE